MGRVIFLFNMYLEYFCEAKFNCLTQNLVYNVFEIQFK